ncbi:non-specific lipid-transfer protein 1-like [Humulus lupulus]|uniref:non-specific lipid-transfer protein 1-like n=1 Tax=Humulus lupulus TaxID=3486 RepID=UPI002B415E86|nr:non-specific lipid-transfer protein 1-like [Humulus lupulus]
MAGSTVVMKLVCLLVVAMAIAAPIAQAALTCGHVSTMIKPCIHYLNKGGAVPYACCNGIRSLNSAAKTTVDRKSTCNCLKSATGSFKRITIILAATLPGKCGVSVPYKISPSTDCNKVH